MIDVIIPLNATGSKHKNLELKYAIYSIRKHVKNVGDIYIVSSEQPANIENIKFVKNKDTHGRKQMNIHTAIKAALNTEGISDNVLFWADDNVVLKPVDALDFPVAMRPGDLLDYSNEPGARVWHRSCKNTALALQEKGCTTHNFEAHTPILFNKQKYLDLDNHFNFYTNVGLCYISVYLNYYGVKHTHMMKDIKHTSESSIQVGLSVLHDKLFVGFNDAGFNDSMRTWLNIMLRVDSNVEPCTTCSGNKDNAQPQPTTAPTQQVQYGGHPLPAMSQFEQIALRRAHHRNSCLLCVKKHVSAAKAYYREMLKAKDSGTGDEAVIVMETNFMDIIGELLLAIEEASAYGPLMVLLISSERKLRYMLQEPDWEAIIKEILKAEKQNRSN